MTFVIIVIVICLTVYGIIASKHNIRKMRIQLLKSILFLN